MKLHESILPITKAALEAGFTVYALKDERRPNGFVEVCLDKAGSFATVNRPTHSWDDAQLTAPIKPSKEFGSSVLVDYDGTAEGAVQALRKVCESPTVGVRFGKRGQALPVVPNYGDKVLSTFPGGAESWVEVKLSDLEG